MGKVDPDLLLSLGDLWGPIGLVLTLLAVPIALAVALRPRLLWPIIIVGAVVGIGPRVRGYQLLDLLLILPALAGAAVSVITRPRQSGGSRPRQPDTLLFGIWTLFMIVQSVIGMLAIDDPRILRWVLLYASLGFLFVLVNYFRRAFPFPSPRVACLLILWSTVASYVVYLAQGMYFDYTLGPYGRFLSQDYIWNGSAIAVFPTLVATPAALLLARDRSVWVRALAWLTAALMMAVALYFSSRMSWLVLAAFIPVAWGRLPARQLAGALVLVMVMFALSVPDPVKNASGFVQELASTATALWSPSKSDVSRTLQLQAGFLTIMEEPRRFFFGAGVYVHRYAIVPTIVRLFDQYLPEQDFIIPGTRIDAGMGLTLFRTTGFTALLIDTGMMGLLLFAGLFAVCIRRLMRLPKGSRMLLVLPAVLGFLWLLSNNILSLMMLYILVMPGGLLQRLGEGLAAAPARSVSPVPGVHRFRDGVISRWTATRVPQAS